MYQVHAEKCAPALSIVSGQPNKVSYRADSVPRPYGCRGPCRSSIAPVVTMWFMLNLELVAAAGVVRGSHVFGQVARVYSRGKRRHRNGSKEAQVFV